MYRRNSNFIYIDEGLFSFPWCHSHAYTTWTNLRKRIWHVSLAGFGDKREYTVYKRNETNNADVLDFCSLNWYPGNNNLTHISTNSNW